MDCDVSDLDKPASSRNKHDSLSKIIGITPELISMVSTVYYHPSYPVQNH
jgi:hypothetical protein